MLSSSPTPRSNASSNPSRTPSTSAPSRRSATRSSSPTSSAAGPAATRSARTALAMVPSTSFRSLSAAGSLPQNGRLPSKTAREALSSLRRSLPSRLLARTTLLLPLLTRRSPAFQWRRVAQLSLRARITARRPPRSPSSRTARSQ